MVRHPAVFSEALLPVFDSLLPKEGKILDPFAGTGKIKQVRPTATLLEIEPEWAHLCGAIVGDATCLPFEDSSFDAVCTSPTYGNRMADSFVDHQTDKNYKRNTYTHCLGRKLSPNNSGAMQWGPAYRLLHEKAWREVYRVLKKDGLFILNIKDHIRNGKRVHVSDWHKETLINMGFLFIKEIKVKTPGNRFGKNYKARLDFESVFVFKKG